MIKKIKFSSKELGLLKKKAKKREGIAVVVM